MNIDIDTCLKALALSLGISLVLNATLLPILLRTPIKPWLDRVVPGPPGYARGALQGMILGNIVTWPPCIVFLIVHFCFGVW